MRGGLLALLLTGVAAMPVLAQNETRPLFPKDVCDKPGNVCAELVIRERGNHHEILRLGVGGCVRGPLIVFDRVGQPLFQLSAGASLPAGCNEQ